MSKSIFFYKQLTAAEVGVKGTHEVYVRLPNDFNHNEFFQTKLEENNSVLEKNFTAKNLTAGHNEETVTLRYVYFANSNKEKRIPSLGDFFKANNVRENDVVILESRIEEGNTSFYISFLQSDQIVLNPKQFYYSIEKNENKTIKKSPISPSSRQLIFYGAPGTGKSHSVKEETEKWEEKHRVVRTTFHPDSDYSTFVGAYKPTTQQVQRYDVYQKPIVGADGKAVMEQVISYEFVPQAFLQAYVDAWKDLDTPEYLVIEEINRGNCAQIFGDLFQLLDRGSDGQSEYAIRADRDLQTYLASALAEADITDDDIKEGKVLRLPSNLYIRATMNTSDQSLFPIDSAFKRRWDWKYVPISNAEKGWKIEAGDTCYDWWDFVSKINKVIFCTTNSEDKQLGYFFCKAKENLIGAETFVGKVIFYLWNDVFKDFGFDDAIFKDGDETLSFDKFHLSDGKPNTETVKKFLENLGVESVVVGKDEEGDEGYNDQENENNEPKKRVRFSINGEGDYNQKFLAYNAIKMYVAQHPDITAEEVINIWKNTAVVSKFLETDAEHADMSESWRAKWCRAVECIDGNVWITTYGWMWKADQTKYPKTWNSTQDFMKAVNDRPELGIKIEAINLGD